MPELTLVIPARKEEYISNTVADACANMEADTRVLVVLDGAPADPPIQQHPKVDILVLPGSVGQRAATNMGVAMADSRYVMKADGHIAFGKGFDRILIDSAKELGPKVVQIPAQRNLHVYSRVCEDCGNKHDQAPVIDKCKKCESPRLRKELVWQPRNRPLSTNWVLNHELEFTYASNKKQVGDICDVMSSLGACMFMERDWFIEIEGFDEGFGSWGFYGAEAALKTWTAGGRHVVNKRTTFAHWFRVGGQGFPYPITGSQQQAAKEYGRQLWRNNGWRKQIHPLRWVVEKFWSELNNDKVQLWTPEQRDALPKELPNGLAGLRAGRVCAEAVNAGVDKGSGESRDGLGRDAGSARTDAGGGQTPSSRRSGIVYYSDCRPSADVLEASKRTIEQSGLPIVAVTLKPIQWQAATCIHLPLERGYLAMFRQILAGLEALDTEYAFFAEHDVLYHPRHWDFVPPREDVYYYDLSWVKCDPVSGRAVSYDSKQTSQLCANRELLVAHYRKRIAIVEQQGFSRRQGFEPGSHRRPERIDDIGSDVWRSALPNIDVRHSANLTSTRWSPEQFRDQRNCRNWVTYTDSIPGWGHPKGLLQRVLQSEAVA